MMSRTVEQEKLAEITEILTVITGKMVIPLYFVFWFLDLIYVPQLKWEFLGLRSLVIPFALITHALISRAKSYKAAEYVALFYAFALASIINTMVVILGSDTTYFYGLSLIAIGGLSFIPWSGWFFFLAASLIYAPYFVFQMLVVTESIQYRALAVNAFITLGIIAVTWVIKLFREKLRNQELAIRSDLEKEIEKRKETEQQLIEARDQALAATRAKESFLANMSHEIRTPLTAIIGYAETSLDSDQTSAERTSALRTIRRSGDHLLNIINDILDFSKIEAGALDVEQVLTNPLQITAEVESIMMATAIKKGIKFAIEHHFPLPAEMYSDPVRMKQILLNLGSNAIKFTEQGSVVIALEYERQAEKDVMKFIVRDSGIGMTAEQLENIFTPFKQADASTTRKFGGTGLGLSLSKQLAELLGGCLQVSSTIGKGSVFTLQVPCNARGQLKLINYANEFDANNQLDSSKSSMPILKGNILLAEDNEVNQQLISLYLEKMGATVMVASNGQQAKLLAQQNEFDLVYMDMQMPVMSGVDAVKQLRAENYNGPIVALTANATHDDRELCKKAGFNDFVTKPIVRKRLYESTARYLQQDTTQQLKPLASDVLQSLPELLDVVQEFIAFLPEITKDIHQAYARQDWLSLKQYLHDLKSTSGGCGYPQLSELATDMDNLVDQQNYAELAKLLEEADILCQRIYLAMPQEDPAA